MTFLKRHSLYFTQLMMRVLPVRDSPALSPLMWSRKASTGAYFFGKQFRKNSAKINVWKRYDSKQLSNDGLTDEGKSRPQLEESPIILGLYNMEPKKKNIKCPLITIAEIFNSMPSAKNTAPRNTRQLICITQHLWPQHHASVRSAQCTDYKQGCAQTLRGIT